MKEIACLLLCAVLVTTSGCDLLEQTPSANPATLFHNLEQRLLSANSIELTYQLIAEGAITANLSGTIVIQKGNVLRLRSTGTFAGQPFDLHLTSDGVSMEGGFQTDVNAFAQATPSGLNEAIIIGATRMGLLHNHARLSGGLPPDHADEAVQSWVQVSAFTRSQIDGIEAVNAHPITFQLTVDEQPSGEATLWLDPQTGLPLQRNQIVTFEFGDMLVTEIYQSITIK